LHSLPPTLFATYERILDRVNASTEDTQCLVQRVLTWIICSEEPLSTKQLLEAISIEESERKLDADAVPDEEGILQWCSSLIRKTPDGQTLELAHFTVEEFLAAIDCSLPSNAYGRYRVYSGEKSLPLAKLCLKYLEFEDFQGEHWTKKAELNEYLEEYPFFKYAAKFWNVHAKAHFDDEEFIGLAKILLDPCKTKNFLHWIQWWRWNLPAYQEYIVDGINAISNVETLHVAAFLSLYPVCEWLVEEKQCRGDINKLSKVGTPLYCALTGPQNIWAPLEELEPWPSAEESHSSTLYAREKTFDYLLDAGANMNCIRSHPNSGLTPLALALRLDFGWRALCERNALVDEACLDTLEFLLNSKYESDIGLVAMFLLKVGDENLPTDRSRLVSLHLFLIDYPRSSCSFYLKLEFSLY
jgi:hypothetical protein